MSTQIPIPEGSIIITPSEVYAKVTSLTDVVTKLVAQDEAESARSSELKAEVADLKARVSSLERKVYIAAGAAAGTGALLGNWLPTVLGQ